MQHQNSSKNYQEPDLVQKMRLINIDTRNDIIDDFLKKQKNKNILDKKYSNANILSTDTSEKNIELNLGKFSKSFEDLKFSNVFKKIFEDNITITEGLDKLKLPQPKTLKDLLIKKESNDSPTKILVNHISNNLINDIEIITNKNEDLIKKSTEIIYSNDFNNEKSDSLEVKSKSNLEAINNKNEDKIIIQSENKAIENETKLKFIKTEIEKEFEKDEKYKMMFDYFQNIFHEKEIKFEKKIHESEFKFEKTIHKSENKFEQFDQMINEMKDDSDKKFDLIKKQLSDIKYIVDASTNEIKELKIDLNTYLKYISPCN